ncbi:unnamed protein product [marine sediment metagenome]|uniref:Uncharacterized protein n=1 Tax=marine sediment metagenome TaxID=412755 RepID=X1J6W5_9ZZZZ
MQHFAVLTRVRDLVHRMVEVFDDRQELLILKNPNTLIFDGVALRDLQGAIRAAIFNDCIFPIRIGLSQHTFNRFCQEFFPVVYRSYNAN